MVRKPAPEVATGLELPGLENREPQNPLVFIYGSTCGIPPAAGSYSVRLLQDGNRGESVPLESQRARKGFPKPGKPQETPTGPANPPWRGAGLQQPMDLAHPQRQGAKSRTFTQRSKSSAGSWGRGYQMTWLLTFAWGNILFLFFLFFKTISFYSPG